ncbi:MAG: pseudouridine synthase [Proteobacteria bacterium]|nr:pseudouridine synthase [Pseudomonadota bacterium]
MKLQKVLAGHGLGSRRAMESWIIDGRIRVNGEVATLGDRVEETDRIVVDGRPISGKEVKHRHLLYNKTAGEICSRDDPEGRPSVFQKLPRLKNQRWISVGRLDFNTTGLLLFTTDGELANRLMHPSARIDREYAVRVLGEVTETQLSHMRQGVLLEDGIARFTDIQKAPEDDGANQWYFVVIMEGRNREVRRLWESQGLTVSRLKRVRFGSFFIPSGVKAGKFIEIRGTDAKELYRMGSGEEPSRGRPSQRHHERTARQSPKPRQARNPQKVKRQP